MEVRRQRCFIAVALRGLDQAKGAIADRMVKLNHGKILWSEVFFLGQAERAKDFLLLAQIADNCSSGAGESLTTVGVTRTASASARIGSFKTSISSMR